MTMIEIYQTCSRLGTIHYYVASSLAESRALATKLAGKRYRYILTIFPTHRKYHTAKKILGL